MLVQARSILSGAGFALALSWTAAWPLPQAPACVERPMTPGAARAQIPPAVVERALAGDAAAFAELVQHCQGPAWALARRITGDAEVAAELVQEAFLRVHSNRDQFRSGSRFEPWFYRILANLAVNAVRHRRYQEKPLETALLNAPSRADGPEPRVLARQRDQSLGEAFDGLPPRYRAALALKVHGEMALSEIASILGCPEGTVKTLLFRAREVLRLRLEAWSDAGARSGGSQ